MMVDNQQSTAYLGNKNLKKSDVQLEFTKEQIEEYVKCAGNVEYFCSTYVKIVHVDKGLVQFKPYEYQKRMFKAFDDNRYSICKMPRQVGKTTGVVGYLLHKLLFNENFNCAVLANKESQSIEILSRMQLAYEWLPKWLQQGIVEWNKKYIELENGSKCRASSTSSSAIRGQSFNLIYLDEFAFVPRNIQDQFFASVFPTISSGQTTKLVITSTPNGMDLFHKIWIESEQEKNNYARVDVHWSDVPGRDQAWADEMIRNTSKDQFRQEFECEFLGSSNTLIHPAVLSKLVWYDPKMEQHEVRIYKEPLEGHVYAMTVDVSEGLGLDSSAFVVVDISVMPYQVVATYDNAFMSELLYPTLLANVGRYYNNAAILVEINTGTQVVNILQQDLEYENIVMTRTSGRKGTVLGAGFGNTQRFGIKTTKVTKRSGCSNIKALIEQNQIELNDYKIIKQLSTYIVDGTTYNAEEGHHDDLVMCLVLFAWMVSQNYFKDVSNTDIRQKILEDNERKLEEEMTPFGIFDDGMPDDPMVILSDRDFENLMLN
jgi:hypothetical protein